MISSRPYESPSTCEGIENPATAGRSIKVIGLVALPTQANERARLRRSAVMPRMAKGARFFKATDDVVALRSQAGPALDRWSAPPVQVQTSGGGAQYYISPTENAKMTEILP